MNLHAAIQTEPSRVAQPALLIPSLERRRLQCYLALLLGDVAALFAGFGLGGYLYMGAIGLRQGLLLAMLVLPAFLTIALYNGAYSLLTLRRPSVGFLRATGALVVSVAFVQFIAFFAKANEEFSRAIFLLGVILGVPGVMWIRLQMRGFVRWRCGASVTNELLIDDDGPPVDMPGACRISAKAFQLTPSLDDPHALDRIGNVLRHADRVVVVCPPERRAAWAMILKGANVDGDVVDETVAKLGAHGARIAGGQGWLVVSRGSLGIRSRAAKRLLDLSLAGAALALLAPLFFCIALAILLEDGRPVFFVQRRLGRGNRFFAMYKFRSMASGRSDADGGTSTARNDSRVTRVGRFIRRTSIDELPQLVNVLVGDMSLVGPRPHAIGSQAGDKLFWEVDARYWQRHALKPGMTGLAQVRGWRGATDQETDLMGRLDADLEYLSGWSLWRDIRILLATIRVVIHDNAY